MPHAKDTEHPCATRCQHAADLGCIEYRCHSVCQIDLYEKEKVDNMELHSELKALGSNETVYNFIGHDASLLEKFPSPFAASDLNPHKVKGALVIRCPEFTSLCPKTGQPDFATIIIQYTPDQWCVESKSLKMYLNSFRNEGEFHEACVNRIANDLITLLDPVNMEVRGEFTPRGGIPFWPVATYKKPYDAK